MDVRHHRVAWALGALALLVPLGVVLSRDGDGEDGASGPPGGTATTVASEATLPLLGTPGDGPDRPALAVKLDNTARGRPQSGLSEADVVVEEVVEGGLTRLLAIFHSQAPDTVGPVRSARSTDIPLLAELGRPLFAWSGANPTFAAAVRAADLIDVGAAAAPDAYSRSDDRPAPYNLYASPERLWTAGEASDPDGGPPPAMFAYRGTTDALPAGAEPVAAWATTGIAGLATAVRWEWDADDAAWLRTQDGTAHLDADDAQVRAVNVIVRVTPYRDSGVRDSTGAPVPEAASVGEGEAWLLTDGHLVRGRWHKADADAPTTYTGPDGSPLGLTPGPTWVEVLPDAGDIVAATAPINRTSNP